MAELKLKSSAEFEGSYKSYSPLKPVCSKLITRKFDYAKYAHHREKLKRVKPMIDNKAPESTRYSHVQVKLKAIQMREERLATIDRDNRLLLQKMAKIMRTSGGLDNQNDYEKRSINRRTRQYELLKITQENQAILKRIQRRKPNLDTVQMECDYMKSRKYIDAITKFPPISPTSTSPSKVIETTDMSKVVGEAAADDGGAAEAPEAATE